MCCANVKLIGLAITIYILVYIYLFIYVYLYIDSYILVYIQYFWQGKHDYIFVTVHMYGA